MRGGVLLAILALLCLGALAAALLAGTAPVRPADALAALAGGGAEPARTVVLELRLPRALAAALAGALLALAGALLQVLLRNPLADPYVLGVSGGAAAGALAALLVGTAAAVAPAALGGALASTLLVFLLAREGGLLRPERLLLIGVVVASGWGALNALLLSLGGDTRLRGMVFWLLGDLSAARTPAWAWVVLAVLAAVAVLRARELDLLARGERAAAALGVEVPMLRAAVYVAASVATAAAVTVAGTVGFVGLVVPHALRLAGARRHRVLLPGCALAGAALLTLSDTLARTVAAPRQLPVGVVTALVGVPVFLVLLRRGRAGP
ncbi:FecCD family ABC transporter permease [Inmirania thermothiophila]|uniref:Iron complex transport system permease protein n=1 Tax=Inmirania thermothiophila TaxID=1750597 RepID=A0A3N1Y854_9GAMM|nr:iron chelate uptake ABC transporter family permease subunit [Inmirania thermothiophila]ROR34999.1 iron complex transport system permease protein [Inmirania thermothiophila]